MKTGFRHALRFTNLRLENWRNFPRVDVELPRRVFLVGANASGKSNWLDVFRFLHDLVSIDGGFQAAVRKRGGVSQLRCLAARRFPEIAIQASLGGNDAGAAWEYELRFTQDRRQRPVIQRERVAREGKLLLSRPLPQDRKDPERLTQTYLEQVTVNQQFRELADLFGAIRYLHIIPQLVREPDRSVGRRNDPYGGDFLEQVARTPEKTRPARLRRIRDALRVAVPQLKGLEFSRDDSGAPHLRGQWEHWRLQGGWQTEEQLSDGTLRLLGLLWAMLDGTGPLLLEEPELSLHSDVARFTPQMLARMERRASRQVLVSTHSTDILRDEGIGLHELLLFEPGTEGTSVRPAGDFAEIKALLQGGTSLAEAAIPRTCPPNAQQLPLFGE